MQMREYAGYVHIHEYVDADENLIHIIHIKIFAKIAIFWAKMGQAWHCFQF